MPKHFLDDAKTHPCFQQVRRVGMPQRVDVGGFVDPTALERAGKGVLQVFYPDGTGSLWIA